jgi:multidrug resistance efflux pump
MEKRLRQAEADGKDVAATKRALVRAGRLEGKEGMTRVLGSRAYRKGKRSRSQHRYIEDRTADERLAVALLDSLEQRERRLVRELDECDLLSPFEGTVVMIGAREGQAVQTRGGDPAFVLIAPSDLVVRMPVPEKLAKILGSGEDAWLEFDQTGASGNAKILGVDMTSYAAGDGSGLTMRDVLVVPEAALLGRLDIGELARVAVRR